MYSDCKRAHTYSITIEDRQIALWYFSRSHAAKSRDFDFLDVRAVVHALSALIFSTPEELGYDKNITRIAETNKDGPQLRYVYRVGDRYFKTLKCLYEYDSLAIACRATRAWEVIEVRDFGSPDPLPNAQPMVLRDVWLEKSASTESEIQKEIFARCDELGANFPPDNDPRLSGVDEPTRQELRRRLEDGTYKDLFLTIEADERGAMSKSVAEGFTKENDVFTAPEYVDKGALKTGADRSRASAVRSLHNGSKPWVLDIQREYEPKQRNFVVYKEVCCALHDLKDLHDAVQALLDCLWAVQILFLIGWIHRDISSGNVLFYNGRGILGDLEYAKKFDLSVGGRSDPRTGTPFFMAVELQTGSLICHAPEEWEEDETEPQPSSPAVRHNFQHDVESFFWILLWVSITRIPDQAIANVLFDMSDPYSLAARHSVISKPGGKLDEALRGLRPDVAADLSKALRSMRRALKVSYETRKHAFQAMETYTRVYGFFRRQLTTLVNDVPPGRVALRKPPTPPPASRSRYDPAHANTLHLHNKLTNPGAVRGDLPHMATSQKRPRSDSGSNKDTEETRPDKRRVRG
ncbi:hypothetical protein C2E23DRAFT_463904 [Lenzites betulinus]|nr:hypothetical protein C2E23DRAFT_463904 [Lenzites betulinus]